MTADSKSAELYERAAQLLRPGPIPKADRARYGRLSRLVKVAEVLERARLTIAVDAAAALAPSPIAPPNLIMKMRPRAIALLLAPELARAAGNEPHKPMIYRAMTLEGLIEHVEDVADGLLEKLAP